MSGRDLVSSSSGQEYVDVHFDENSEIHTVHSEFEGCQFTRVNLSDSSLSRAIFRDCDFVGCDLSRVRVSGASFQDCRFETCRLMAIDWSSLGGLVFGIQMAECKASYSIFDELNLKWCSFSRSDLAESSFQESNLSGLLLDRCNLSRADFRGANLTGTDLSSAIGIVLQPSRSRLKGTRINMQAALDTLAAQGILVD